MTFQIIDDIQMPEKAVRTRIKSEFTQALDNLAIGQGFEFESQKNLKANQTRCLSSKFPVGDGVHHKKFDVRQVTPVTFIVKRLGDIIIKTRNTNAVETN